MGGARTQAPEQGYCAVGAHLELATSFLVAMRSSIMISCLLSSSVHALLVPATRPGVITNHPAAPRLGTPVMKGSLGRRVLLLAPLAPLLAAPASVLAVPSVEDKRNADREKVARHIRPALLKNSQDKVIYIVEFNQQRIADQKDDAKVAQIRENKPEMEGGLGLPFYTFVLAVILFAPLASPGPGFSKTREKI